MPKTDAGKWSIKCIIVFFALFAISQILVALGEREGDTFFANPLLAIIIILTGTSGALAFFTGFFSVTKQKEHSLLVYLSISLGFFITFFILSEIIIPH